MEIDISDSDLVVVINSCDAYEDVRKIFFSALEKYWCDCNYPIVVNTEKKQCRLNSSAIPHICPPSPAGDQWGRRLVSTLRDLNAEFVLVVYDDFILEDYVDNKRVEEAVRFLKNNTKAAVLYLTNIGLKAQEIDGYNGISLIEDRVEYKLNSAPAIWRRADLLNYTDVDDDPWAWEVFGSYRTYGDGREFYCPSSSLDDIYSYKYKQGGAVYRGKWVWDVVKDVNEKFELNIDFNVRGIASDSKPEKRSLKWKLGFLLRGYKMVGMKSLLFIVRYARQKLNV